MLGALSTVYTLAVFTWKLMVMQCFLQYSLYVRLSKKSFRRFTMRDSSNVTSEVIFGKLWDKPTCTPTAGLEDVPRASDTCLATRGYLIWVPLFRVVTGTVVWSPALGSCVYDGLWAPLCRGHPCWIRESRGVTEQLSEPDRASRDLPTELLHFNFSKYLMAVNTRTDAPGWEFRKYKQDLPSKDGQPSWDSSNIYWGKMGESEQSLGLAPQGFVFGFWSCHLWVSGTQ